MVPRLEANVPKTAEELKRVKKAIREKSVERIERLFVLEALKRNEWSVTRSAEETGMQRTNFQALMKKYQIRVRGAAGDAAETAGEAGTHGGRRRGRRVIARAGRAPGPMRRLAFAAVALTLVLYALTVVYDRRLEREDPVGYRNVKTCPRLAPGITVGALRAALGEPTRREPAAGGERLEFRTLSAAAAPIRADVDGATGKVVALWCGGDDRPTWQLPRP